MDKDLDQMSREQLVEEVKRLRQAIRQHRDSSGHELCGIIQRCGDCCRRKPILFPWCRTGRSSFKAA